MGGTESILIFEQEAAHYENFKVVKRFSNDQNEDVLWLYNLQQDKNGHDIDEWNGDNAFVTILLNQQNQQHVFNMSRLNDLQHSEETFK